MMRAAFIVLAAALALLPQGPLESRSAEGFALQERSVEDGAFHALEGVIADARRAPPEFEADALIRIAQSPRLDKGRRRDILNDAFMRAYAAQDPYRRVSYALPPDSRQGVEALAFDSRLTRVSLQVRATQMMAFVDPPRARELFEWIDPGIGATRCEEALVPGIAEYYTALSTLARTTFAASRRADAIRFLELYLWRAHLPVEMPAIATAVLRFASRYDEAAYFETVLRLILENGGRDPRGFSVAGTDVIARFAELEDRDRELGITGWHLLHAVRAYMAAQTTGPRCADSPTESLAVEAFNARVRRTRAMDEGVRLLDIASVRPSALLPPARIDRYWQTADARRLREDFLRLRGRDRNPVPLRIRLTKGWREEADQLVTNLEHWTGSREPADRDYFFQKGFLFTDLIALMPRSPARERAIQSLIAFLRHADVDRLRRTAWFLVAGRLLEFARGPDRVFVIDAMESTHHPILALYARLERAGL